MSTSNQSNFRRGQSKVWWGNSDHFGFPSLQQITKSNKSNVSPDITTSWSYRRGSPGSLKSQDSGFSDSDHSPPTNHHSSSNSSPQSSLRNNSFTTSPDKLTPKKTVNHRINTEIFQRSPSICSDHSTPPTVIRKKLNADFVSTYTSRRISFSAPNSPVYERIGSTDIFKEIDSLNYSTTSPVSTPNKRQPLSDLRNKCDKNRSIKRGTTITRSAGVNRKLLKCVSQFSIGSASDVYQLSSSTNSNESLEAAHVESLTETSTAMQKAIPQTPKSILKASPKKYNNETVVFGCGDENDSSNDLNVDRNTEPVLPTYSTLFPTITSTPKSKQQKVSKDRLVGVENSPEFIDLSPTMNWETCTYIEYTNPLLNGNASSVQYWLDEIRSSYCHEVLSTLQTKSIAHVISKSAAVNSVSASKIIRSVQVKAENLQGDFECVEQFLSGKASTDAMAIVSSLLLKLNENVMDFVSRLRSKNIFATNDTTYNRFEDNISCITEMTLDLQVQIDNQSEDMDFKLLFEDVQVLKRYLLITIRLAFVNLIKVILHRIETTKCDLILRSNLSMISMLSNTEFKQFASLNDAFIDSDAVRLLLTICLESKLSTVRTLSLRALATICSTKETIRQFQQIGGIEILTELLTDDANPNRLEPEFREALSLLAQLTAPWHGKTHSIDGLRSCVEKLVERISDILTTTICCQTLLLCAACLNNLSRMETTSIYSLMSHGTVLRLKQACQQRGPGASIFLYEQVINMLYNMACNRKCHKHLANKHIISFITSIFKTQFYGRYRTRSENTALNRTIKTILHIFAMLIHESSVGKEILDNNIVPIFSQIEENLSRSHEQSSREISRIVKLLNDSLSNRTFVRSNSENSGCRLKQKSLLESYV
ncbi:hypothetical protein Bhyg_04726 [Pseudolycoriella hygida]|uniref:Protein inscuteable homologue C-terminal domain-containing protein n=1 Tax=Pseudolycoriella hygida TaxID=35572 RepID=A0A9Q0SA93_9DIPT|nr:hypothetical protein Bhyg_04726 [Pseudolycoriella hygida]